MFAARVKTPITKSDPETGPRRTLKPTQHMLLQPRTGLSNEATLQSLRQETAERVESASAGVSEGEPLPADLRSYFEPRFGHDFSRVRVHNSAAAGATAQSIRARAFTCGRDIAFAPGEYAPGTARGRCLLAHELVHVVQASAGAEKPWRHPDSTATLEGEANQVSARIGRGVVAPPIKGVAGPSSFPLRQDPEELPTFSNLPRDIPERAGARRVELIKQGEKWKEVARGRTAPMRTASGSYDFVVLEGRIYAVRSSSKFGHTEAALGRDVTWAGQIEFSHKGALKSWNNASGHHLPSASFAENAARAHPDLPMGKFSPFREVSKRGSQLPVWRKQPKSPTAMLVPETGPGTPVKPAIQGPHAPQAKIVPPETKATSAEAKLVSTEAKVASAEAKLVSTEAKVASAEAKTARSLGSVAKWGKVSPFDLATLYLDMHAAHFAALENVSARVAVANNLLSSVTEFENGATELRKAVDNQWNAEVEMPRYPIQASERLWDPISAEELEYVSQYYDAAARLANDAMAARVKLNNIVQGWDAVLDQANKAGDFTRKSAWEAVTNLDLRFSKGSRGFRAFLEQTRDRAGLIERLARAKQYFAADILGKWVPPGYTTPEPPEQ